MPADTARVDELAKKIGKLIVSVDLAKAEWDESKHPRDNAGQFAPKAGGSLTGAVVGAAARGVRIVGSASSLVGSVSGARDRESEWLDRLGAVSEASLAMDNLLRELHEAPGDIKAVATEVKAKLQQTKAKITRLRAKIRARKQKRV